VEEIQIHGHAELGALSTLSMAPGTHYRLVLSTSGAMSTLSCADMLAHITGTQSLATCLREKRKHGTCIL
jgi:hypothetical protein